MSRNKVVKLQKLLPTEAVEIEKEFEGKLVDVDADLKQHLPLINCECGAELLLLPDLQAMNSAIHAHATEHQKKERSMNSYGKISQLLSQLTLRVASEQNDT